MRSFNVHTQRASALDPERSLGLTHRGHVIERDTATRLRSHPAAAAAALVSAVVALLQHGFPESKSDRSEQSRGNHSPKLASRSEI